MEISVVIPSFNNCRVLRRTLDHLAAQTFPHDRYEVIVADDGSTDGTEDMVRTYPFPGTLRYVAHRHGGFAATENLGVRSARGRVILFVDSDFWVEPGLLAAHHCHYPAGARGIAVQGITTGIHPDALATPFMRVKLLTLDLTVRRRHRMSPHHVVNRNLSMLKADFDAAGGLDEAMRGYGYEDLDLALRMTAAGVILEFEPEARGVHYHVETLADVERKQYGAGWSAVYVWRKHRRSRRLGFFLEILPWMLPLKWLVYRTPLVIPALRRLVPIGERRNWLWILNECYKNLLQAAFYRGVFEALRTPPGARAPAPEDLPAPAPARGSPRYGHR
ncbi:MAG TPA: glycosyltransferase [bacterium]|nr:glycosyltransferase [bacterium]